MTVPLAWFDTHDGPLWVVRQCPICGRFLKIGTVITTWDGMAVLEGWLCSKCGEVKPEWGYNEYPHKEP